jgi:aminopeptidase
VIDELGSRYAELAVRVGANVQPGQTLFVLGEPEHAALMRAVAAAGWAAGAGDVQPIYRDEYARRLHALHAAEDKLDRTPGWIEAAFLEMEGAALVVTLGDADPNLFDDVDQSRAAQAEPRRAREIVHDQVARQACAWCMIACPTPGSTRPSRWPHGTRTCARSTNAAPPWSRTISMRSGSTVPAQT